MDFAGARRLVTFEDISAVEFWANEIFKAMRDVVWVDKGETLLPLLGLGLKGWLYASVLAIHQALKLGLFGKRRRPAKRVESQMGPFKLQ
jgi:hypothetical protein